MKKTLFALFFCFLMMFVSCVFASADASGMIYSEGLYNNDWKYVESEKTLYIYSKRTGYNETGNYSTDGAWSEYKDVIEHIVLEGAFTKVTNNAFKGHTALKDIRITAEVTQFDANCFEGCTNLESITVGDNPHIKGVADLSYVTALNGGLQFKNTKITKAYIAKDVYKSKYTNFVEGATVYVPRNTKAYELFLNENRYNLVDNSPVDITFVLDGKEVTQTYAYGSNIQFPIVDGDCVALYTDPDFKTPYSKTNAVERDVTLYCKKLMDYVGGMVRSEDYQGLRMIYSVDENALSPNFKYKIKEYGAISMNQNGLENLLELSTAGINKAVVYSNGKYEGRVLSVPYGGITEFAHTATGFDGDDLKNRAEQNLLFRGYVVLVNKATGEEVVSYTESIKINLAEACKKTLEINNTENVLSSEAVTFINSPLAAGAVPNYVYTKVELISLLNTVYNDNAHYIPGQHLSAYEGAIADFLNDADNTSGKYPALVSFDLQDMTVLNRNSFGIIEECKEYIDMGGIVSFSWHMENPTDQEMKMESSDGELGGESVWEDLIDEKTDLNKRFREILDSGADILREFDKEGYPVMFRPFHEHNGDWFWWCALQGDIETGHTRISESAFINLWKYVYNYYTNDLGLDNIVWVYAPNVSNSSNNYSRPLPVSYGYPGESYCDIVGADWYIKTNAVNEVVASYNKLKDYSKPFAITEFGPQNNLLAGKEGAGNTQSEAQLKLFNGEDQLNIVKKMLSSYKLTFVVNWNGQWSMKAIGNMDKLLQDETALDIYEVKDLFNDLFLARN